MVALLLRLGRAARTLFGLLPEGVERVGPEPVEVLAQRVEAAGVQGIEPPCSFGPVDDEAGELQDAKVLGDRRPADRKPAGKLADGLGPVEEARQNGLPGGIRKSMKLLNRVSVHLR